MEKIKISIVIPVFNGSETITELVEKIIKELTPKYETEVVLVDDHSLDNSAEVCKSLYDKNKNIVRFFELSKNVGEHNTVMAGLQKSTGDYAVIMDDDFQNPVEEIHKLIEAIVQNSSDVVYSYYDRKYHSRFRNIGSWINDRFANIMLGKPRDLYLSSFKIINRFTINEIIKYDLPFPYVDALILRVTNRIHQIKVNHKPREKGKSGYKLTKLISLWLNMMTSQSILPLRVSVVVGFLFSAFGILFGTYTIYEKINYPDYPIGLASIMVMLTFFGGVQLIAIGILGEYLGRIFGFLSKTPQFVIRKYYPNEK